MYNLIITDIDVLLQVQTDTSYIHMNWIGRHELQKIQVWVAWVGVASLRSGKTDFAGVVPLLHHYLLLCNFNRYYLNITVLGRW